MRLGCLVLHGLTSSLATVDGLVPYLRARELPYRLPLLRGHGATPDALRGVTWRGWHDDAARALDDLLGECERAVVIGLSMGGVVALHLAAERPERLAGVAVVAPALKLAGTARDQLRVGLAAADKRLVAVDGSGHEMMQDREREAVFAAIMAFVDQVRSRAVAAVE